MPTAKPQPEEVMRVLNTWGDVIEQLLAGETTPHELAAYLDRSQRTIRRSLETLEENGLVCHRKNAYRLTQLGHQIAWAHCDYQQRIERVTEAAPLLIRLPFTPVLPWEVLDGVEQTIAPPAAPDVPFDDVERSMKGANTIRGIAPHIERQYVEVFGQHVFEFSTEVELILAPETIGSAGTFYPDQWDAALERDHFTVWPVEDVPPFGVILVDAAVVWIGVYPENGGGLVGTLRNDTETAVQWAREFFERYRTQADGTL